MKAPVPVYRIEYWQPPIAQPKYLLCISRKHLRTNLEVLRSLRCIVLAIQEVPR